MTIEIVHEGSVSSILALATPGRVLTVYADDAASVRREVVAEVKQSTFSPTVVSIHWQQLPPLQRELNEILQAMAEAASGLWPRWYATVSERFDSERWRGIMQ